MIKLSFKKYHFFALILVSAISVPLIVVYSYYYAFGNIHTVIPGGVYRSARLRPALLKSTLRLYRIKSVLDLDPKPSPQEASEAKIAINNHVKNINFVWFLHNYTFMCVG